MSFDNTEGQLHSTSPEQTQAIGRQLAAALRAGDIVALDGDLGAGKTCLIQGIAEGLGVQDIVNSPTFVLLNVYEGAGQRVVYHFDLYRLADAEELEQIGAPEFFDDPRGISLVEWAERMPQALPSQRWHVRLQLGSGFDDRIIIWRRPASDAQGRQSQ